jgi:hypothetical protein
VATTQRLVLDFFRPAPIATTVEQTLRLDSARALAGRRYDTGAFFARGDREGGDEDRSGDLTVTASSDRPVLRRATTRLILLRRRMSRLRWLAAAILVPSLVVAAVTFARERVLEAKSNAPGAVDLPLPPSVPPPAPVVDAPPPESPSLATAPPAPPPPVAAKAPRAGARPNAARPKSRPRAAAPLKLAEIVTATEGVPSSRE